MSQSWQKKDARDLEFQKKTENPQKGILEWKVLKVPKRRKEKSVIFLTPAYSEAGVGDPGVISG